MKQYLLFVITFMAIIGPSFAAQSTQGGCEDIHAMKNFNMTRFEGFWYGQELFENYVKCLTFNVTRNEKKNKDDADSWTIAEGRKSGFLYYMGLANTRLANGQLKSRSKLPGEFTVSWNFQIGRGFDYTILLTDYDNFAVVYSCQSLLIAHRQDAVILTRIMAAPEGLIQKARAEFVRYNFEISYFTKVNHRNCYELPEVERINYGPIALDAAKN